MSVGNEVLTADKIFINVGARAKILPMPGVDQISYLTNSSILEVDYPKLLCLMLLESVPNDLHLADVSAGCVGLRVVPNEHVNSGLIEFLATQQLIKFGTGCSDGLSCPVGDLSRA